MSHPHTEASPQRAVAERNVEAILEGAERLLLSGRTLNFSAVAAEAGVSRPTLYAHFADRARLLGALVERSVAAATEAMVSAEPDRGPAPEALGRVVTVGWEHVARHQAIAGAALAELPRDALHEHHRVAEDLLVRLIARGQSRGEFRGDLPAPWMAASCLAIIHTAASSVASGVMHPEQAVDVLVTTVVDLCVGPGGSRRPPAAGKAQEHRRRDLRR